MAQRVLSSAASLYAAQQNLIALGLAQAYRTWNTKNWAVLTALLSYLQYQAAQNAIESVAEMAAEQSIVLAAPVAEPVAEAFSGFTSGGAVLSNYIPEAESLEQLLMGVTTQVADATRGAEFVAMASHLELEGYVRYLNPPSCGRCTVLAGRVYPYSVGFERHPNCDCVMIPVSEAPDEDLVADAQDAFDRGLITDLTQAEVDAINDGANVDQVINVRRRAAGLTVAGRVLERRGRLTPEGIFALAGTRDEHIRLLIENGYMRA